MSKKEEEIIFPLKPVGPPKVWKIIETKKKDTGAPIKFSIQQIPEDRYEDVIDHMCKYFIADEPMSNSLNGINEPEYVETFKNFWNKFLKQGLSVVAFTENVNGGKPIIAGCNMLGLSFKGEEFDYNAIKSENGQKVVKAIVELSKKANVFEKYGVDKYMTAFGLSVNPSYRGAALGGHLLNARVDIGREYNISVTSTAFTSPISQKLAARCGFETLIEKDYVDMVDEKGNQLFPEIKVKSLKVMSRKLF
ncbi:arylalkylamine N-acetyltransferase-like 2 [Apis laboriosa]|uniref:arylalkylamine N-acetyltransferase-like 2 n=1 Tax=Apis laboriosa TaxID=183418 RepID=UPI001CC3E7F8|nr:arylalkylamine N-acetyltransferase-like 2 [Apis laboriosa]